MNHLPPCPEHQSPPAQGNRPWWHWQRELVSPSPPYWGEECGKMFPNTSLESGNCHQLKSCASGPTCHPAPALPSGLALHSLILLETMGQNPASSPLWSLPPCPPTDMLAEVQPSCARAWRGLSERFTKEGLEKEKPLKTVTSPGYALKGR